MFSYASYTINKPAGLGSVIESNKAKSILLILGNRYPVITGSCMLPSGGGSGGCVPNLDDKADFWSYQAVESKEAAGGVDMTVYALLQTLPPGAKALVDVNTLDKPGTPIVFLIAKNDQVCKFLASSVNIQELPLSSTSSQTAETKGIKGAAIVGGLLAAAAGALVAGPAGAIVAGGVVGFVLQTQSA